MGAFFDLQMTEAQKREYVLCGVGYFVSPDRLQKQMANIAFFMQATQLYCFFKLIINSVLSLVIIIHLIQSIFKRKKKQGKTKLLILLMVLINLNLDTAYDVIYANEHYENCNTVLNLIAGASTTSILVAGMLSGNTILQPLRSIQSFCKTETLPTEKDIRTANIKLAAIIIYGIISLTFFTGAQFFTNNSITIEK